MSAFKTTGALASAIAECTDVKSLLSVFGAFADDCGANAAFVFTFSFGEYNKPALLAPLFSTFPDEVLSFYTDNACMAFDPVVRGALASSSPVKYTDFHDVVQSNPLMKELFAMMDSHDIIDGISMHASSRPGRLSYVSLGFDHSADKLSDFEIRRIHSCVSMFTRHGASLKDSPTALQTAPALSFKEREVVYLLACGASNKEIAQRLALSPSTVNTLVNRCFEKLGASTRAEAAIAASRSGLALVA